MGGKVMGKSKTGEGGKMGHQKTGEKKYNSAKKIKEKQVCRRIEEQNA